MTLNAYHNRSGDEQEQDDSSNRMQAYGAQAERDGQTDQGHEDEFRVIHEQPIDFAKPLHGGAPPSLNGPRTAN